MNVLKYFGIERRKHRRHVVIDTVWVRSADDITPSVCILWDISEGGARLAVADPTAIGDECILALRREDRVGTKCRVVWRSKEQIGLQFTANAEAIVHLVRHAAVQ